MCDLHAPRCSGDWLELDAIAAVDHNPGEREVVGVVDQ
jgi:hypothetical protein